MYTFLFHEQASTALQTTNWLIINQQGILFDLSQELLAQCLIIIILSICIGSGALQNIFCTLSAVAVTVHVTHLAAIDTIDNPADQRLPTDRAIR